MVLFLILMAVITFLIGKSFGGSVSDYFYSGFFGIVFSAFLTLMFSFCAGEFFEKDIYEIKQERYEIEAASVSGGFLDAVYNDEVKTEISKFTIIYGDEEYIMPIERDLKGLWKFIFFDTYEDEYLVCLRKTDVVDVRGDIFVGDAKKEA